MWCSAGAPGVSRFVASITGRPCRAAPRSPTSASTWSPGTVMTTRSAARAASTWVAARRAPVSATAACSRSVFGLRLPSTTSCPARAQPAARVRPTVPAPSTAITLTIRSRPTAPIVIHVPSLLESKTSSQGLFHDCSCSLTASGSVRRCPVVRPRPTAVRAAAVDGAHVLDSVDRIVAEWRAERPDLRVAPIEVLTRLSRVRTRVDEELASVFAGYDLSPADFTVIAALRRAGAPYTLPQSVLMARLGLTSGTVSVRLGRLEGKGIVTRAPSSDDARGVLVTLTVKGAELFDRVAPVHLVNEDVLLSALTDAERGQLAGLLRKLLVGFEHERSTSPLGFVVAPAHVARRARAAVGLSDRAGLLVQDGAGHHPGRGRRPATRRPARRAGRRTPPAAPVLCRPRRRHRRGPRNPPAAGPHRPARRGLPGGDDHRRGSGRSTVHSGYARLEPPVIDTHVQSERGDIVADTARPFYRTTCPTN